MTPERKRALEANIWKLKLFASIRWFLLFMPIFVPYMQSRTLSLEQIFFLQAVFSVIIVGFDVPTGYFADRRGRKLSLVISSVIATIALTMFAFSTTFTEFLIAEVLLGIGSSFMSGAVQSLLWESLVELGREKEHVRHNGKMQFFGRLSEGIASVVGGFLAAISLAIPMWVTAAVFFLSIPVSLNLTEPHREKHKQKALSHLIDIFMEALHRKRVLKWVIIFGVAIGVSTRIGAWLTQPLFADAGVPLSLYGVLWAAFLGVAAITSYFCHHIHIRVSHMNGLLLVLAVTALGFLIISFSPALVAVGFIVLLHIRRGLQTPFIDDYIHSITSSDRRATVFSIEHMLHNVVFAATITAAGAVAAQSIQLAFLTVGIVVTATASIAFVFTTKAHKTEAVVG